MIKILVYAICFLCFVSVTVVGWNWSSVTAVSWMKIHPATYLSILAFFVALTSRNFRHWWRRSKIPYAPFGYMALILIARGIIIALSSNDPTGAVSVGLTTFLTPFLFLVASTKLSNQDWGKLGQYLRVFLVVNSLVALGEAWTKTSIVFVQEGHLFRSGGLLGHPLSSAMVTGFMLVYLLTAANRQSGFLSSLPELILHALAMFAYGGRTGLLLVPLVVVISAILPNRRASLVQRIGQRAAIVILVAAGLAMSQLQIDIVQNALARFQSDSGSSETRLAALRLIGSLSFSDLMLGINPDMRASILARYNLITIENPYISMIMMFGIILTGAMIYALVYLTSGLSKILDRSASFIILYFFIYTIGNISFGSRSLVIIQMFIFILAMCQAPIQMNSPAPNRRRQIQREINPVNRSNRAVPMS